MQDSATSTTIATNTDDVENCIITWTACISQDKPMMEIFSRADAGTARSLNALPRLTPIHVECVVGGSDVVDNARQSWAIV